MIKDWSANLKHFPKMKAVGELTSKCLKKVQKAVEPGITTADLEDIVKKFQKEYNLKNSQFGFHGFPSHACIGKNEVVCHGIPSKKIILNEGDIVKVDVTFNLDGFHGDSAKTFSVGHIDEDTMRLMSVAITTLRIGLTHAYPGNKFSDIGAAIESYVIGHKMKIIKEFTGHGILTKMHEPPVVRHFWDPDADEEIIVPGMTFTIEPIVCAKNPDNYMLADKWTVVTKDKCWSAQEEITIGITETGYEIFTPHSGVQ